MLIFLSLPLIELRMQRILLQHTFGYNWLNYKACKLVSSPLQRTFFTMDIPNSIACNFKHRLAYFWDGNSAGRINTGGGHSEAAVLALE